MGLAVIRIQFSRSIVDLHTMCLPVVQAALILLQQYMPFVVTTGRMQLCYLGLLRKIFGFIGVLIQPNATLTLAPDEDA